MTVGERFERLVGAASRRPVATLALVIALALAGAALALSLKPSAGIDTFVPKSSVSYQATVADQRHFGQDAVIVLIHESLPDLLQTRDLATLTELEACFAGQYAVPSPTLRAFTFTTTHAPYGGAGSPCAKLARFKPAQVVYGPGSFLNRAVAAVNTEITTMLAGVSTAVRSAQNAAYQLAIGQHLGAKRAATAAKAAGQLAQQQQYQTLERLALTSGITSLPSIDSPQFIPQVVYDQTKGVNQPKSRFAYLFPTANSALIQIRLRASLTDGQQAQAIGWIRQAIAMPMFRSAYHGTYTVTGEPVVLDDLANTISGSIAGMLIAVLLVMAVALLIVFRSRLRLLPLALALAAAGITFGLLALLGASLTLASVAVLPILIGLGVDYGIQFQARAQEARRPDDAAAARGESPIDAETAVARAAGRAAPTIATAALATATGFLVLLLSPVPMVQGFGLLLVAGIVVALGCALTAGSAALILGEREGGALAASVRGAGELVAPARRGAAQILAAAGAALTDAGRGAAQILSRAARSLTAPIQRSRATRDARWGRRRQLRAVRPVGSLGLLGALTANPGRILAVAAVLAVGGWVADTQTAVQSDVTKLVPPNMPALRNLRTLERVTGVSGEIDVTVGGANVASPSVVGWMIRYEKQLLTHYGYLETRGCAQSTLCPALSLPDLFSTSSQATTTSSSLTQQQ
ncbi:MAG: MMPL family transporter, partial [Solirubrobacteraceae bacterium]